MTLSEYVRSYLAERGMLDGQIEMIVAQVRAKPGIEQTLTAYPSVDQYPQILIATVILVVNATTLKYFDENCPEAYNRALFEGGH